MAAADCLAVAAAACLAAVAAVADSLQHLLSNIPPPHSPHPRFPAVLVPIFAAASCGAPPLYGCCGAHPYCCCCCWWCCCCIPPPRLLPHVIVVPRPAAFAVVRRAMGLPPCPPLLLLLLLCCCTPPPDLMALRTWCKQCLASRWKPDALRPGIVWMRGSISYYTIPVVWSYDYGHAWRCRPTRTGRCVCLAPLWPTIFYSMQSM